MERVQIHAAAGPHDVKVLAADRASQNRSDQPRGAQWLTTSRTRIAVRVQGFFETAEEDVVTGYTLLVHGPSGNRIKAEYVFPAHLIAFDLQVMGVAVSVGVASKLRKRHKTERRRGLLLNLALNENCRDVRRGVIDRF